MEKNGVIVIGLDEDDDAVAAYYEDLTASRRLPLLLSLGDCGWYLVDGVEIAVLRNSYHILAMYRCDDGGRLERLEDEEWPEALLADDH